MKINTILSYPGLALLAWLSIGTPVFAADEEDSPPSDTAKQAGEANQTDQTDQADASAPPTDHVTGSYLSGQFARNSGDIGGAIHSLQRVHMKEPDNRDITVQLEGLLLLDGQVNAAMDLAQEMGELDSKDPLASLMLVLREVKDGHIDEAQALLDDASETGSGQLWVPLVSAWLDLDQHALTTPLTMEKLTAEVGRAAPLVNYHLALVNARAGFTDAAAENFKNAIEDPKNPPTRVMAMLLKFYKDNNSPAALTPLVEAYRASHPDSKDEAAPVIANTKDGVAEVLYTMGGIMFGAGVVNDAAIYLELALYVKPGFSEATLALADADTELEHYARANSIYASIPAGNPFYAKAQLHIAVNDDKMGKLKEALALLDKLGAQSHNADALITKADLLRIHARYAEAAAIYVEVLKRVPKLTAEQWPVVFALGACLERQGKWAMSEKYLRQALELSPDEPEVLNYLAYGWLEHGEHITEARNMIEKAVKARPNDAEIIDSMGWALYLEGDYPGATKFLEKAVEMMPGDPTVNDHLGDAYWRSGRKTEARYQWEQSLAFSPESRLADTIHKKLKDGLPPTALAGQAVSSVTP